MVRIGPWTGFPIHFIATATTEALLHLLWLVTREAEAEEAPGGGAEPADAPPVCLSAHFVALLRILHPGGLRGANPDVPDFEGRSAKHYLAGLPAPPAVLEGLWPAPDCAAAPPPPPETTLQVYTRVLRTAARVGVAVSVQDLDDTAPAKPSPPGARLLLVHVPPGEAIGDPRGIRRLLHRYSDVVWLWLRGHGKSSTGAAFWAFWTGLLDRPTGQRTRPAYLSHPGPRNAHILPPPQLTGSPSTSRRCRSAGSSVCSGRPSRGWGAATAGIP